MLFHDHLTVTKRVISGSTGSSYHVQTNVGVQIGIV